MNANTPLVKHLIENYIRYVMYEVIPQLDESKFQAYYYELKFDYVAFDVKDPLELIDKHAKLYTDLLFVLESTTKFFYYTSKRLFDNKISAHELFKLMENEKIINSVLTIDYGNYKSSAYDCIIDWREGIDYNESIHDRFVEEFYVSKYNNHGNDIIESFIAQKRITPVDEPSPNVKLIQRFKELINAPATEVNMNYPYIVYNTDDEDVNFDDNDDSNIDSDDNMTTNNDDNDDMTNNNDMDYDCDDSYGDYQI